MSKIHEAVLALSDEKESSIAQALESLRVAIEGGGDLDERNDSNLRPIDVLVRRVDSEHAAQAIEMMAETDFAEKIMEPPSASEMPPMMMACFMGKPQMVEKFLELGMPGDVQANAPKEKILKGTPFHAVVMGYREAEKESYAACLSSLLAYCPEGLDVADRLRQRPVDLATKAAAVTGDRTLADAMIVYGAELSSGSKTDAAEFLKTIGFKDQSGSLASVIALNAANGTMKKIERSLKP